MKAMTSLKPAGLALLVAVTGCATTDSTFGQTTTPQPMQVSGPPGATMGPLNVPPPGWGPPPGYGPSITYGDPNGLPSSAQGYPGPPSAMDSNAPYQGGDPNAAPAGPGGDPNAYAGVDPNAGIDPNAGVDPNAGMDGAPGYDMNAVTDQQIESTLDGYGSWQDDPDYGEVWRPDTTQVGVDFTPYQSCGTWVNTDYGPTFDCTGYSWGWLPFHYGRWGWFGNYWGWAPGHQWSPAAVEWRHGGGYVGWRPLAPALGANHVFGSPVRAGVLNSQWRFTNQGDFFKPGIGAHLFNNPAEGLRVTQPVAHLPVSNGTSRPIQAASLMRARYATSVRVNTAAQARVQAARVESARTDAAYRSSVTYRAPAYRAPSTAYRAPTSAYRQPAYHSGPAYRAPAHQEYDRETPHYSEPSHSSSSSSSHSSSSSSSHSSGGGGHSGGGHGGGGHR